MKKPKFVDDLIAPAPEASAISAAAEGVRQRRSFWQAAFPDRKDKRGGLEAQERRRLLHLEAENRQLRREIADLRFDRGLLLYALRKRMEVPAAQDASGLSPGTIPSPSKSPSAHGDPPDAPPVDSPDPEKV